MKKVLIDANKDGMPVYMKSLINMLFLTQDVYNDFKAIDVIANLQDLKPLFESAVSNTGNTDTMTEEFVRGYLIEKTGGQTFNGAPADVSSIIQFPDVSHIVSRIKRYKWIKLPNIYYCPELFFFLNNDIILLKGDAFETIKSQGMQVYETCCSGKLNNLNHER